MRSYIVRVYRRGKGGAVSGTVQAVDGHSTQPPRAFSNTADLLACLSPLAGGRDAPVLQGQTLATEPANMPTEDPNLPQPDS